MAKPWLSESQEVFFAVQQGDLRRLINEFPTFDYVNTFDTSVADSAPRFTAIHWAACLGHYEIVRWILSKGVGAALRDNQHLNGMLRCGVIGNNATVIRLLLDAGADRNWVDSTGFSALRYASFLGHTNAELVFSNYFTEEEIAAFSIPDGNDRLITLPTELVKPLRHLIMMINSHPIRIALDIPPMFFDGNNPKIIDTVLKTMRYRKIQYNPQSYDTAMSYKLHLLSCVLNAIKNEDPVSDDSTQTDYFITRISRPELLNIFLEETLHTFPYTPDKYMELMDSISDRFMAFPVGNVTLARVILEYSCGDVKNHPVGTPICILCKEPGASKKCSYCGRLLYCDQKCELLNRQEHDEHCDKLFLNEEETDTIDPLVIEDLQDTTDTESQELEQTMTKEVEEKPTREWLNEFFLNIIIIVIILIYNIYLK